jgi:hypothetical protein
MVKVVLVWGHTLFNSLARSLSERWQVAREMKSIVCKLLVARSVEVGSVLVFGEEGFLESMPGSWETFLLYASIVADNLLALYTY